MSTGTDDHNGAAMPRAVTSLSETSSRLVDVAWWQCDDATMLEATVELDRVQRRIDAARLSLLQRMEARGSCADTGAADTAAWLRGSTRARPGRARAEVTLAVSLTRYPLLEAALAAGSISLDQLAVCVKAMDALPATVPADKIEQAQALLVKECATFDPIQLAKLGKHLLHVLDPDGPALLEEDEQAAVRSRELRISECEDGVKLRGFLDREAGSALLAALSPLSAPRKGADGTDVRTPSQRNADALVELAHRALNAGDLPVDGGERPHVTVTLDHATLVGAAGAFGAELDRGGPLSAEAARAICCDAKVVPVVLDGAGQPLDVGREQRTVPRHMRRAVVARDRGCAFPGCDRPPAWCDAHHIVHWADGGETALHNLVLLCRYHHNTVIHHTPWQVRVDELGRVVFTSPNGATHQSNADVRREVEHLALGTDEHEGDAEPRGP